jgi:DNA ligase-1
VDYSELVEYYERLESTQSTLDKTDILAELFREHEDELGDVVMLSSGRVFPKWKNRDTGLSSKTMVDVISRATGRSEEDITEVWREEGDLGLAAEEMVDGKTQQRLVQKTLTVQEVMETLDEIASMEEEALESIDVSKKVGKAADLVSASSPQEARYVVRNLLQNMRLGVAEGLIRDALAEAFFDGDHVEDIQHAYDLTNDFRQVAEACRDGINEVKSLEMEIFRPVNSMLAKKVESIKEGFEEVGKPAGIDFKYDGVRAQIHVSNGELKVFTRRLEDITDQFPDVVEAVEQNIDAENVILDTEITGYNPESNQPVPFQRLSKRVKRKYDIEKLRQEIPVEVRPFDLIYHDGSLLQDTYEKRLKKLRSIVEEERRELRLVDHTETGSEERVAEFDQRATSSGHEGIMMKKMDARYKPGKRVGYMVKLKPVMETLDLAVVGAKWSEGRRSGWLGRLKLGAWNEEEQRYEMVGRMATGLTDEELEEITNRLKPLITEEDGRDVTVEPEILLEVEYEEIQESPTYESGYALRFPRLKSFRDDKEQADTKEKLERLYTQQ